MSSVAPTLKLDDTVNIHELDNDITLLDVLRSVGRVWKQWFIAIIIMALLFIAAKAIQYITIETTTSYKKAIKFTFPGVEKSLFPNDSPFQLGDILSPSVISEVYDTANLENFDLSVEEFRASLTIEPYSPTYPLIVHKFNTRLNNSKLSPSEIQLLQSQMTNELALATNGAALLSLTLEKNILPDVVVGKVLADIPATWAKRAIIDKGVLDLNIQLASSNSLNNDLFANVDYLVVGDLLKEKMTLINNNISKLFTFEGATTIKDPETGVQLVDLKQKVNDLQVYVIDELMSPVRSLGLTKNRQLSLYYYQDKKRFLTNKVNLYRENSSLVKEAFDSYDIAQKSEITQSSQPNRSDFPIVSSLPSSDVLDKLLFLSQKSKTEAYRQSLNQKWLDLNLKVSGLNSKIVEVDRIIEILKQKKGDLNTLDESSEAFSLRKKHLDRAEVILPKILNQIRDYLDITQRIYKQLSIKSVGTTGHLYKTISNKPFFIEDVLDLKKQLLILLALLFLTSIIIVPIFMLRNTMKNAK